MHHLSDPQRQRLEMIIEKFPSFTEKGLGRTKSEIHMIDTRDAVPVKSKHYPVSPAVQKLMYAELDRMLNLGVIEESNSPWSHPVTLVRRGDKNRLCLDARRLNALTVKDAYPLPHIEGLLSRLGDTYYISSVDLKDAFWQIPLEASSREKTAFTVPGRPLYHFKVMPFGLCNAAQRLCRLMDKVIPSALRDRVFVYLDDLLIVSPDFDTHLELLERVANHLAEAGLTINVAKSKFCFKQLRYLGYIVGGGELKPDPAKIETITRYHYPKTPKQVRSFMGATGWYRRFIADYATIAAPIFETLKKGRSFQFPETAREAFDKLKNALITSPVLTHPDFSKHFYVQCDASDLGIGAVLFQRDEQDGEHPIAYFSQKLSSAQKNYSVTERECLAVVMAIKKFRPYIELMPFTIITDHSSLKWLMSHKDLSGRLARWSLHLQTFSFDIEHRKGKENIVPDTLSRYDMDEVSAEVQSLVDLSDPSFVSEDYLDLVSKIKENTESLPDLRVVDGYVYKRTLHYDGTPLGEDFAWKLWIPVELSQKLIENAHCPPNVAHGGFHKTLRRLREYFFWPNMSTQVRNFVQNCKVCKEAKPANSTLRPPMGKESIIERPFQRIYVDFLGPYPRSKRGNSYIFIVLDHLSKFVLLKAMSKANTKNVVKFLIAEVFHKFGTPETIVSDNGQQFVSKEFADVINNFGIKHIRTATHSPQANASERVNQSILAAIRSYLRDDQRDWDKNLSEIECSLRSSVHSSIGVTPYFALFGMNMVNHGSIYELARKLHLLNDPECHVVPKPTKMELMRDKIRENLHQAYLKNEKKYNMRSRKVKFIPGQEIYRRSFQQSDFKNNFNAKLGSKFIKCRVVKPVGNCLYELEDLKGKSLGVFHGKDLKQ